MRMRLACLPPLLLSALLALTTACGGDDDDVPIDGAPLIDSAPVIDAPVAMSDAGNAALPETLPTPLPTGGVHAKLVTYNLGLISTIRGAMQRKPFLIDAIKAADADVLCLQEVWNEFGGPAEMAALLADTYPYAMWSWTSTHTYGNGLVIVSKHPLYRGREHTYAAEDPSNVVDRMVIAADVVTPDSYFHVLCTHPTAFSYPQYVMVRKAQFAEAKQFAMDQGYWNEPTVFLGDLNSGPATGCSPALPAECMGVCAEYDDESYTTDLITDWDDPHAGATFCTYCYDIAQPLQLIPYTCTDWEYDQRIDHCLTRNVDLGTFKPAESGAVFAEGQSIPVGMQTLTHLSDHLGVRCVFAP